MRGDRVSNSTQQVVNEMDKFKADVLKELDTIVAEVNRLSFGGSKIIIIESINRIAVEMDLPKYEWAVNVSTGQSERVS